MRHCDSHPSTEQKIMKWNLSFGFEAWESPSTRTLSLAIFTMRNQREMPCLWTNRRAPGTQSSEFTHLSCPLRSPQQSTETYLSEGDALSMHVISGLNGILGHQQLLCPLSKTFPQDSAPKHPVLCLCFQKSVGHSCWGWLSSTPTWLSSKLWGFSCMGKVGWESGPGRRWVHPASWPWHGSTPCWKHW